MLDCSVRLVAVSFWQRRQGGFVWRLQSRKVFLVAKPGGIPVNIQGTKTAHTGSDWPTRNNVESNKKLFLMGFCVFEGFLCAIHYPQQGSFFSWQLWGKKSSMECTAFAHGPEDVGFPEKNISEMKAKEFSRFWGTSRTIWNHHIYYLEDHPRYRKWLGSPPFFSSHKKSISKGSHNPT